MAKEWSELERQIQISNRLQACPWAANTQGDGRGNVSGHRSPAPKVKLPSWVQAGCVWDQHLHPVGSCVLQSCSDPAFHPFTSLVCRADGRGVKLMRKVTVRYFVKKTTRTPHIQFPLSL